MMRALLFFVLGFAAACSKPGEGADGGKTVTGRKVRIVATTGMVADLARVIGGDHVEVTALMGPGVDPHLYTATAGDVKRMQAADLILYNGLLLEGKMGDLFVRLARKRPVVAVTEVVPQELLREPPELEGHYDPHLWFDVSLWAKTCGAVAEALADLNPQNATSYRANAKKYERELLALHEEVKARIAEIPKERRVLITSHDAFGYMGRAYDIEVAGLQGITTGVDAGVRDVERITDLILERGIKAVFIETSVSPKLIEAVRERVRKRGKDVRIGGILFSDAMGDTPPVDTYLGMVRRNVDTIVEALR